MKLPIYENFKYFICDEKEIIDTPLIKKIISGVASGAIAIVFATPAEIIKVKMQAQARGNATTNFTGNMNCAKHVWGNQGPKGFFYGLVPNIMRNSVMNCAEMVAYDTAKDFVRNKTSFNSESVPMYVLYGFIAGAVG